MKISVDRNLCEANAVCCGLAPDVFGLDEDELLVIHEPPPGNASWERIRSAVERCPKTALELLA